MAQANRSSLSGSPRTSRRPSRLVWLIPMLWGPLTCMASETSVDGEVVPPTEPADIAAVVDLIKSSVQADFDQTGHAVRDAHRKAHGCVQATFTVLDTLPPKLSQGLFATPRSYPAVVRFSNGSGQSQDDRTGDARGMAVKLMGVPGKKLLEDEASAQTQDFIMINHPVFFVRNASDYVGFQRAIDGGTLRSVGWFIGHLFHETRIALAIRNKEVSNPLNARYWSMTPSKLGTEQMKFSAMPCVGSTFVEASASRDRLRDNVQGQLASKAACFDFMVQTRDRPGEMPIEDPTVEWDEKSAPFTKVARIDITPQTAEQGEACEVRSFSPWHAVEAHRPLGGISRVRKNVYQTISTLRHRLNGQPRVEPGAKVE
ncbi:hypothetical protein AQB9606_03167 [Aquabacterium sp. CECT 9606]|nr:hypothetical protein AQB9606_03167 [Aquabacterium sp. CECT 9606]